MAAPDALFIHTTAVAPTNVANYYWELHCVCVGVCVCVCEDARDAYYYSELITISAGCVECVATVAACLANDR